MTVFPAARQSDITSNARIKSYPTLTVLQVSNAPIFRQPGWESQKRTYDVPPKGNAKNPELSRESASARARAAVRDIALCNKFAYFFTFTLSPEKIDRYDQVEVYRVLKNFLKNTSYRKGFSYVLVPELHKDGAIHCHGLCNLGEVKIEPAFDPKTGRMLFTERGQQIYNMCDWKVGFSTCIQIDSGYEKACSYLVKYITKDSEKIFGKWYLSSRNLVKRPQIDIISGGMDYDQVKDEHPDLQAIQIYKDVNILSVSFPLTDCCKGGSGC